MKVWGKVIIVLVFLLALVIVPVVVAGNGAERGDKLPYNFRTFVPCAADGAGEYVDFSGYKHEFRHITRDSNGGYQLKVHLSHHLTGRGDTTGDLYKLVGAGDDYFLYFPPDENGFAQRHVVTLVITRPVIGIGQAVNGFVHETAHYTMNANGEVAVDFIKRNFTCK